MDEDISMITASLADKYDWPQEAGANTPLCVHPECTSWDWTSGSVGFRKTDICKESAFS